MSALRRGDSTHPPRLLRNPSPPPTPTSNPPSPARDRSWVSVLKTLILLAALVWVGKIFVDTLKQIRAGTLELHLQASWLFLSAGLVLVAYVVLIATWLYIVSVLAGRSLPFLVGAP